MPPSTMYKLPTESIAIFPGLAKVALALGCKSGALVQTPVPRIVETLKDFVSGALVTFLICRFSVSATYMSPLKNAKLSGLLN